MVPPPPLPHRLHQNHLASSLSSPPDSGRIRCVCEYDEDDGFTIQCEQCLVWQHAKCVGISKNSVPEQYFCEECNPGWHDDLHNLALRAINLDVLTTSTTTAATSSTSNNPSNVNIIEESNGSNVSMPTRSFKRKISMPPGVPALNEISENIISNEAQPVIDSFLTGLNISRLKRQQTSQDASLINFEFQSTVVLDSAEHLALLQKNLEVREIRSRGYQKKGSSTKFGLFSTEPCDPGHFVCEFIGHVQVKSLLTIKGAREFPVSVTQTFVLYPFASIELAVDSRKFGTGVRYARRSCRPNVQIKPIIVETSGSSHHHLSWGLFARNIIKAGSEILLPLDYQCGNGLFKYECACNSPEFCLGPLDLGNLNILKESGSGNHAISTTTATASATATTIATMAARPASPKPNSMESTELEALGIRRSSSTVLQDSLNHPLSTATRPILDTRKLSREERKLQKYIEYFEKMDHADAAKKVTTSSSNSSIGTSSRKGGGSFSVGSSPQPSSSRISSPEKAGGLKKAWKKLFSSSGEQQARPTVISAAESNDPAAGGEPAIPKKRGRKPSIKTQSSEPLSESRELEAPGTKSPPKRKKGSSSELVAIVDEEEGAAASTDSVSGQEEIDVGSEAAISISEGTNKKIKLEKTKKTAGTATVKKQKMDDEEEEVAQSSSEPLIDIERSSSVLNNAEIQAVPSVVVAAPDTPSKKKLSLSDYLKKKKASPSGPNQPNFDEEEGEITQIQMTSSTNTNEFGRFLHEAVVKQKPGSLEEGEFEFEPEAPVRRQEDVRNYAFDFENSSSRDFFRHSISEITSLSAQSFDEIRSGASSTVSGDRERERERDREREYAEYNTTRREREYTAREYTAKEYASRDSYREHAAREYASREHAAHTSSTASRDTGTTREHATSTAAASRVVHPPQMLSKPSAPISRYRDEREKEFDRLQREREFERREAERDRERRDRLERMDPRDREIQARDHQANNHPSYPHNSSNRFYNHSGGNRGGYRPPFHPHPHRNNNPDTPSDQPAHRSQGYRPPSYKNHKYN